MLNFVMEKGYRLSCATCFLPEVCLLSYPHHHDWGWGVWPALPAPDSSGCGLLSRELHPAPGLAGVLPVCGCSASFFSSVSWMLRYPLTRVSVSPLRTLPFARVLGRGPLSADRTSEVAWGQATLLLSASDNLICTLPLAFAAS